MQLNTRKESGFRGLHRSVCNERLQFLTCSGSAAVNESPADVRTNLEEGIQTFSTAQCRYNTDPEQTATAW